MWFNYLSSKLGEDFIAINAILLQFIIFASFILDAYAFSTEAVVGYAIGRKEKRIFLKTVSNSVQLSLVTGLVISAIYIIFSKSMINVLTSLEFLKFLSYEFIVWIVIIPPIASLCYQFDGIFIGASQTGEMRNAMIISFLLFIISINLLVVNFGNHGLWLCLLFFMIIRFITLNYYFKTILKKILMQFIYRIPGYILLLFGGFCLSWGGFIVRSFETADPWQILLLRSFFFFLGVSTFLFLIYKSEAVNVIRKAGLPGLLGGFVMSFSFIAFVFAMLNTSVANVVFIISTQTMFLAIFGYFYLKEKVSLISFVSILLAMAGITIMIGDSITSDTLFGNIVALTIPISFSILVMIVRKILS